MKVDGEVIITSNDAVPNERPNSESTWDAHKQWLVDEEIFPNEAVDQLTVSTDSVASLIDDSEKERIYGLIVGHVQSGKLHTSLDYSLVRPIEDSILSLYCPVF